MWVEMYEKGYFADPREKNDQKFFVDGSAAMYLTGDWHTGSFVAAGMEPGETLGTFLTPPVNAETGLSVIVADDPLTCVARGGGKALEIMDTRGLDLITSI